MKTACLKGLTSLLSVVTMLSGLWVVAYAAPRPFDLASPTSVPSAQRSSDLSYYAYGPLTIGVLSAYGRVVDGKYCREVLNNADHRTKVQFVNLTTGEGPTFILRRHRQRTLCIPLGSSPRTHYALLQEDPEVTYSAGVWTPHWGRISYASKQHPRVLACSRNPLNKPAVLNFLKSSLRAPWRNVRHTGYVAPGQKACVKAHQDPDVYNMAKVNWAAGKQKFSVTYQVLPAYSS